MSQYFIHNKRIADAVGDDRNTEYRWTYIPPDRQWNLSDFNKPEYKSFFSQLDPIITRKMDACLKVVLDDSLNRLKLSDLMELIEPLFMTQSQILNMVPSSLNIESQKKALDYYIHVRMEKEFNKLRKQDFKFFISKHSLSSTSSDLPEDVYFVFPFKKAKDVKQLAYFNVLKNYLEKSSLEMIRKVKDKNVDVLKDMGLGRTPFTSMPQMITAFQEIEIHMLRYLVFDVFLNLAPKELEFVFENEVSYQDLERDYFLPIAKQLSEQVTQIHGGLSAKDAEKYWPKLFDDLFKQIKLEDREKRFHLLFGRLMAEASYKNEPFVLGEKKKQFFFKLVKTARGKYQYRPQIESNVYQASNSNVSNQGSQEEATPLRRMHSVISKPWESPNQEENSSLATQDANAQEDFEMDDYDVDSKLNQRNISTLKLENLLRQKDISELIKRLPGENELEFFFLRSFSTFLNEMISYSFQKNLGSIQRDELSTLQVILFSKEQQIFKMLSESITVKSQTEVNAMIDAYTYLISFLHRAYPKIYPMVFEKIKNTKGKLFRISDSRDEKALFNTRWNQLIQSLNRKYQQDHPLGAPQIHLLDITSNEPQ